MGAVLSILALAACLVLLIILMRQVRKWSGRLPELSIEKRREQAGLCHACGYNLKGVPSYMCPECGIVRLHPAPKRESGTAAPGRNVAQPPSADFDELSRVVFDRGSKSIPPAGGTQPGAALPQHAEISS